MQDTYPFQSRKGGDVVPLPYTSPEPRLAKLLAARAVLSRQDGVQNADLFMVLEHVRSIGRSWANLGSSWAVLALAGAIWGHLGAILGPSWAIFGDLVLEPSWGHLGAILGIKNEILLCVYNIFAISAKMNDLGPKCPNIGQLGLMRAPRQTPRRPKTAQDGPRRPQDGPKTAKRRP